MKEISKAEKKYIQGKELTTMDISYIQIFHALIKYCSQNKKDIHFNITCSHELEDLLANAGFDVYTLVKTR